jgi:hypothetical protein
VIYTLFNLKKEEILSFAGIQIKLKDTVLKGMSHTQKGKYCITSLICGIPKC